MKNKKPIDDFRLMIDDFLQIVGHLIDDLRLMIYEFVNHPSAIINPLPLLSWLGTPLFLYSQKI